MKVHRRCVRRGGFSTAVEGIVQQLSCKQLASSAHAKGCATVVL
jgi:hypothetical protein